MTRSLVASSNIRALGYDPQTRVLEVEFRPNKAGQRAVWAYRDVPADVYADLIASESIGRAFTGVKTGYDGQLVAIVSEDGTETPMAPVELREDTAGPGPAFGMGPPL